MQGLQGMFQTFLRQAVRESVVPSRKAPAFAVPFRKMETRAGDESRLFMNGASIILEDPRRRYGSAPLAIGVMLVIFRLISCVLALSCTAVCDSWRYAIRVYPYRAVQRFNILSGRWTQQLCDSERTLAA